MQSSAINLTPRDLVSGAYRPPSGSPWHVQAFGGVWSRPQLADRALHSLGRQLRSQTHRDQVSLVNKPLPILGQQLAGSQLLEMPPSATIHTAANPSSTIKSENLRTPANRRCRGPSVRLYEYICTQGRAVTARGLTPCSRDFTGRDMGTLWGFIWTFFFFLLSFLFRSPVAPLIVQHGNRVRLSCSPASPPCDVM